MAAVVSIDHELAVLHGKPAFSAGTPVPLIYTQGHGSKGDFSIVDAILANEPSTGSQVRASQQRFVAKILPGVQDVSVSFRAQLQGRIRDYLGLNPEKSSVVCVTSGTNALRAVLRAICGIQGQEVTDKTEVIVPQTTVGATVESVIALGFTPVFVSVDPGTWLLDPVATEHAISKKTAAIVTVDWLGTQCNLEPFRKLADNYGIKLISDSAQSFGAGDKPPPAVDLAHATIYSMGYPKVFTGGGSGGIIVCPHALMAQLECDGAGILRHETLAELNASQALRALEELPLALSRRSAAGESYRNLLAGVPGIAFQQVPGGLGTNHYQVSLTVDPRAFGLNAIQLCQVMKAENVHCSADRMPCVATNPKFQQYGRAEGDDTQSRLLASNSVTLPISNVIKPETVQKICELVKLAHIKARDILEVGLFKQPAFSIDNTSLPVASIDLESKYRNQLVVPVLSDLSVHSKIILPHAYLLENRISIDELLMHFLSRMQWKKGERVVWDLVVDAIIDGTFSIILAQKSTAVTSVTSGTSVILDESGSSASVMLVPESDGTLIVRKSAEGYGVDGNGAPWLRRQLLFLSNSTAVEKTGLFVIPSRFDDLGSRVTLDLPYIPSHSFGELAFANVGAKHLVAALVDMLACMATSVWTEGQEAADTRFIEKAHFERMRRRVNIARKHDRVLDEILNQETVMLNSKRLLGFEAVLRKLASHPMTAEIQPKFLNEIHGDLNIHNILSRLNPGENEGVTLIDPRGVPLLGGDDSDKNFERGDYVYDISKLLFSLTGFSEIRKRLFDYTAEGDSHSLTVIPHPGSDTINEAAHLLIPELAANRTIRHWIDRVEKRSVESFELRVKVGEAAHFVADCACALGRKTPWEIVPLFLLGLEKLNSVVDLLDGLSGPLLTENPELREDVACVQPSADFGVAIIQNTLFRMQQTVSAAKWPYDVLEISVKSESASVAQKLLQALVGTYLPKGTLVHLSTNPLEEGRLLASSYSAHGLSVVLIHQSNGTRGQTHMLAAAARRTTAFFRDNGFSQYHIDRLRIVHISSTGSSSRSQFTARSNDKLLSPGVFGISPLQLAVMQSVQLPFPKPGRWIVENDSFFLLSQDLALSGDHLCLLTIRRPTSGSSSSWRVCIDKYEMASEKDRGIVVVKSFRDIHPHEYGEKLLRATTGIFVPHRLAAALVFKEDNYAIRTSSLLFDLVLPHFMGKPEWISLCHQKGFGANSHLAWANAAAFGEESKTVELAYGGEEMVFYHFGSDIEYHKMLAGIGNDTRLNSLAYVGAAANWLQATQAIHARLAS